MKRMPPQELRLIQAINDAGKVRHDPIQAALQGPCQHRRFMQKAGSNSCRHCRKPVASSAYYCCECHFVICGQCLDVTQVKLSSQAGK